MAKQCSGGRQFDPAIDLGGVPLMSDGERAVRIANPRTPVVHTPRQQIGPPTPGTSPRSTPPSSSLAVTPVAGRGLLGETDYPFDS